MCIDRIINGANKIDETNCLGRTTRFKKVKKRDEMVKYLSDKAKVTKRNDMNNMMFDAIINMINTRLHLRGHHTKNSDNNNKSK